MAQKIKISKYAFRLLVFSIIMTIAVVLMQILLPQYASPALPFIIIFFFFITLFTLYVVLRVESQREARKFVSGYVLSRTVKFMSCLLFLLLYLIFSKEDKWNFAIAFLIIYFLYAGFELYIIKKENAKYDRK